MKPALIPFWRDERGISAVEFALIAPMLFVLAFGVVVITEAIMMQRKLQQTAQSVAWAADQMAAPATATANATIDANTQTTLLNIVLATQRVSALPAGLKLTLRRYVGSSSGPAAQTLLVQSASGSTQSAPFYDVVGAGDPGADINDSAGIQAGDAVFAVDASLDAPILSAIFGAGNFTLRSHSAM